MKRFLVSLLFIIQLFFSPWAGARLIMAFEVPEAPSAPTAPSSPEAPSAPSAPSAPKVVTTDEAPSAPDAPDMPTQNDAPEAPKPSSSPTAEKTSSNPIPSPTRTNTSTDGQNTATNTSTGADSTNVSDVNVNDKKTIQQDNEAKVNNDIVATSISGGNNSDKNTGDGSVTTGDASVNGLVTTQANTNQTSLGGDCGGCPGSGGSSSNSNTGAGSSNESDVDVNSDTLIVNNNQADLDNGIIAIADSGHNSASKNTGNGEVVTGDANVSLTVVNVANTDITGVQTSQFDVYDDHNGDIVIGGNASTGSGGALASNSTTGADSDNRANADSNTSLTIVNNNDATVASDLVVDAVTGHNTADKNTGDGSVTTGDANVVANVVNLVNTTADVVVATINIFGNLVGDIILDPLLASSCSGCTGSSTTAANSKTGADSTNESSVGLQRISNISQNNEANINNSMVINANTGGNDADKNTGSSSTITGEVNVEAQVMNVANNNLVGTGEEVWWVVVVNEAGKWVGKIMGADDEGNVAVVDTIALNDDTGAGSNNQANVNQSSEIDITQNNTANVANNVVINADTGHNSASANTGNGSISTGDVNVYSNVINYVNNNFIGGKVVITFVNVFGSWVGDLITPGNEKVHIDTTSAAGTTNNENVSQQAIGGSVFESNESREELTPDNEGENGSGDTVNSEDGRVNLLTVDYSSDDTISSRGGRVMGKVLPKERIVEEDDYLTVANTGMQKVQSASVGKNFWSSWTRSEWMLIGLLIGSLPLLLAGRVLIRKLETRSTTMTV